MRAITGTIVFEASAVNRDENIGGNVLSIKKLRRGDKVFSFFSRAFMRHKLFNALHEKHGWKETTVTAKGGVIQFDISQESILTSEEMDFFGYMSTVSETAVRKAPVGLTKAVSLEPWSGDVAFYANHDLVARARKQGENATPNPFQREEHLSLYKYSFVVDLEKVGEEEIVIGIDEKKAKMIFGIDVKEVLNNKKGVVNTEKGEIKYESINNKLYRFKIALKDELKRERIKQFLDVVLNGFSLHSSTEDWSTVPVFAVVGTLNLPLVAFHSYVELKNGNVDADLLKKAFENTNVEEVWVYPGRFSVDVEGAAVTDSPKKLYEEVFKRVKEGLS